MFRVVKALDTAEPAFFLLCDHKQCMEARRGTAITANMDDYRLTKKQFLTVAMEEGWWVDLECIYCPFHAREMVNAAREAEKQAKTVVPASPGDLIAFGKSR